MRKVRLSLIGVGGYGRKLAIAIGKVPSLQIVSCYHPSREKTMVAAREFSCQPAFYEKDIFQDDKVDAVIIATPDPYHFHYIQSAIEGGKHIFVEKPMVGSWEDACLLGGRVNSYNGVFFVGHNMRREAGFHRIKKEYDEGLLGQLVTFQVVLSHGGAFNWSNDYWRSKPEFCREGPLRVNGVHASDILEYLFGPIESVYAKLDHLYVSHETPDSGIAMVKLAGVYGTIYTHWNVPSLNHFQFQFTDALVNYDLCSLSIRYGRDQNCIPTQERRVDLPEIDSRVAQMEEFAKAILADGHIETGWHEGFRAVMFFEACWRSFEQQREYRLEELR